MDTYQIGNKIKCILSSYVPGYIGQEKIDYAKQPYTILHDIEATINFDKQETTINRYRNILNYAVDHVESIELSNIVLTDKIINLIYNKEDQLLRQYSKNYDSNEQAQIFLPNSDKKYNLFIYNNEGKLEQYYEEYDNNILTVKKSGTNYLIFYSLISNKGFNLENHQNIYLSIDLEIEGNYNETKTQTFLIHLDKCSLSINKNLYFNNDLNNVDLVFKVLDTNNYIILE